MVTIQVVGIERHRDDDGEITEYVVEYSIPQYPNTYRTEPIPADEFEKEQVKERIAQEAAVLVSAPTAEVEFPDETDEEDQAETGHEESSRRSLLRSTVVGFILAAVAGGGVLAYMAEALGLGEDQSVNEIPSSGTPTATRPPTETGDSITQSETPTNTDRDSAGTTSRPRTGRFSFEQTEPGDDGLPEPWSVVQDPTSAGFNPIEISAQHATHETQTLHMSGNGELDRILVGFVGDLTDVQTVQCDVYIERANVSVGEIFFGKWVDGESTKTIGFLGQTGGEGQDRFDATGEFLNLEGDLADFTGEHELVFNVRGDNEAYFDNLRFFDREGNLVSPLE